MNPFQRREVARTADFRRILELPKRVTSDGEALAREMTEALRTPEGEMSLRPVQAQALYELLTTGGLFGPMGVGTGKTLVFLLAPVVLNLRRALGLLPASLVEKTERERATYARHFRVDRSMQLISYEMLGRVNASNLLAVKRPDGLITDESHKLKNPKAACTRRVARYLKDHPDTRFVSMSGTMIKNSLRDFAHLLRWSLSPEKAPVPQTEAEVDEWSDALDERVQPMQRVRPGALATLAPDVQGDELERARKAFHVRLVSTPGVVCSLHAEQVDCSLYIEGKTYGVNAATEANFERLRTMWETPDGWALSEAVDVWRHARELALGFHYVRVDGKKYDEWRAVQRRNGQRTESTGNGTSTSSEPTNGNGALAAILAGRRATSSNPVTASDSTSTSDSSRSTTGPATSAARSRSGSASTTATEPGEFGESFASLATGRSASSETTPTESLERIATFLTEARPPDWWLTPRRAWAKFVRDVLSRSRSLDSEKQVALACERGDLPDTEYRAWMAVRDRFVPKTIAVWHDDSALKICEAWLRRERGICWVDHTMFGRELARRTGLSYFGQNGLDDKGRSILDAKGPIIASVAANGTGKNLQAWHKNLITSCPTGASVWEQLLGRTHRPGQKADEVEAEVLIGCVEHVDAWERARAEAEMSSAMLGQPQKILFADVTMPSVEGMAGSRWTKSTNTK